MGAKHYFPLADQKLTLDEAIELGKELFVKDGKGDLWIKLDTLRELSARQPQPEGPKIRTFEAAKIHAAADPELAAEFEGRPPNLGPTPAAA